MKVQSLSIVVPNRKCVNNCEFCVSKMHERIPYNNKLSIKSLEFNSIFNMFLERLEYAREYCDTIILTGTSEPLQNISFLNMFNIANNKLIRPFRKIELQTTGVYLDGNDYNVYTDFLKSINIKTISLSVSSLNKKINNKYIRGIMVDPFEISHLYNEDFNIRFSLNMTEWFNTYLDKIPNLFEDLLKFNINEVTFRQLYSSNIYSLESEWVKKHRCNNKLITQIGDFLKKEGRFLEYTTFNKARYSYANLSVLVDDDCMSSKNKKEEIKYLILRENGKLYTKWDDLGSIVF